jgi:hypothetical protein
LNRGGQEGLSEGGARQSRELFLVAVVLQGPIQLWATARGGMEIDFGNSWRKVFEKTEDQVKVHVPAIIHTEDEMIRADLGLPELVF